MVQIEELEMNAHRAALESDVRHLVDKYRAIFGWNVRKVDEALSERLIVAAMRQALDALAEQQDGPSPASTVGAVHFVRGCFLLPCRFWRVRMDEALALLQWPAMVALVVSSSVWLP